jgi:hypothetical protein
MRDVVNARQKNVWYFNYEMSSCWTVYHKLVDTNELLYNGKNMILQFPLQWSKVFIQSEISVIQALQSDYKWPSQH